MKRKLKVHATTAALVPKSKPVTSGKKTKTKESASKRSISKRPNSGSGNGQAIDTETRLQMIAQEAYFRAERRGFAGGGELGDWLEAERDVARMLG